MSIMENMANLCYHHSKKQEVMTMNHDLPKLFSLTRSSGESMDFLLRRCTPEDLDAMLALQNEVYEGLPKKHVYVVTPREDLLESIAEDCCLTAVAANGKMAGFSVMVNPRISPRNYGTMLGYRDEQLLRCVSFDLTVVSSEFRGFGLQRFFVKKRLEQANAVGAREAFSTIAPDNEYSLNNLLACGFEVIERRTLYGGYDRCLLRKTLCQ